MVSNQVRPPQLLENRGQARIAEFTKGATVGRDCRVHTESTLRLANVQAVAAGERPVL